MTLAQLKDLEPLFGSWYLDSETPLGKGAFGSVYRLRKEEGGVVSYAAMKAVSIPNSGEDLEGLGSRRARINYISSVANGLKQEIELMSELRDCKNVVAYEDCMHIVSPDRMRHDILIRMELLSDLDSFFKLRHASAGDALQMWRDLTVALMVCEKRMIVHRDIKPSNIMVSVDKSGHVTYKLVDFGIARRLDEQGVASTRAGSVGYMAPEVYAGKGGYSGSAVDIYSLGIVVYRELNCMRYPFLPAYPKAYDRNELDEALTRRLSGAKVPPIPRMPSELNRVLLKCLEYDPAQRYATASDLMRDLTKLKVFEKDLRAYNLYSFSEEESNPPVRQEAAGRSSKSTSRRNPMSPDISKKCPVCGEPVSADLKFCTYCGTDLTAAPEEKTAVMEEVPSTPIEPVEDFYEEMTVAETSPRKSAEADEFVDVEPVFDGPKYCPNGHNVDDPSLGFCPECGMPLVDKPAGSGVKLDKAPAVKKVFKDGDNDRDDFEEVEDFEEIEEFEEVEPRICANCGYECTDPELKFCPSCGTPFADKAKPAPKPAKASAPVKPDAGDDAWEEVVVPAKPSKEPWSTPAPVTHSIPEGMMPPSDDDLIRKD